MLIKPVTNEDLLQTENNFALPSGEQTDIFSDKNSVIIQSTGFISILNLRDFWVYRELFYFLALRDIKIRYKQTALGIIWILLQPLIATLIFAQIALHFGGGQDLNIPCPLFVFSGFTVWTFINAAITNSSNSLLNHSALITKVFFPRLIIPLSAVGATLLDLFIGLISLLLMMIIYDVFPSWKSLLALLLIVPILLSTLGLGILTAALNVKYRDVKYIMPFALQVIFFVTPVFYSLSVIPQKSVWIWRLNPFAGSLENLRAAFFDGRVDWYSFSLSFVVSIALLLLAVYVFHNMEDDFADVI